MEVYTEKDELIYSGKTNQDGKIVIKELAIGKYYIVKNIFQILIIKRVDISFVM